METSNNRDQYGFDFFRHKATYFLGLSNSYVCVIYYALQMVLEKP